MNLTERQRLINEAIKYWAEDWNRFVRDVLGARLDREQQAIIESVQVNPLTAVASGTARGKDFVAACASLCFMYLTPRFDPTGKILSKNTKVAMTAPTGRQVENIMKPEIHRLVKAARAKFPFACPGRLVANDIRTDYAEWFLTGFKADNNATEAWSGFHAANVMFVVTEATGISETIFNAIEGNLQGNSRLLLVFNPNIPTGYAAKAMTQDRFQKFRLNSLNAENVVTKQNLIPGQVDYRWVAEKVKTWCTKISKDDFIVGDGDFEWEGNYYRPNDLFRVKVLGLFPKVSTDTLIPYEWIELAVNRWKELQEEKFKPKKSCLLGVDVAGMGRDASILCPRYGNYVPQFIAHQSAGQADHMHVVGMIVNALTDRKRDKAFIDTIGEGAGVYSRLKELNEQSRATYKMNVYSCKFSEGVKGFKDSTGQIEFANMRAYLYWKVREWLDPKNGYYPALPPCEQLMEEAINTHWKFQSDGRIIIEPKDDIKERLGRSPDWMDALANTFYPKIDTMSDAEIMRKIRPRR